MKAVFLFCLSVCVSFRLSAFERNLPEQTIYIEDQARMVALSRSSEIKDRREALNILGDEIDNLNAACALRVLRRLLRDPSPLVRGEAASVAADSMHFIMAYGGNPVPLIPILRNMSTRQKILNEAPVRLEGNTRPPEKAAIYADAALYEILMKSLSPHKKASWRRRDLECARAFVRRGDRFDSLYAYRYIGTSLKSPADHVKAFELLLRVIRKGLVDTETKVLIFSSVESYVRFWGVYKGCQANYKELVRLISGYGNDSEDDVRESVAQTTAVLNEALNAGTPKAEAKPETESQKASK